MMQEQREKAGRAILRRMGFRVESVAWVQRHDNEFAALVCAPEVPAQYDRALEFLTTPGCPVQVVRERVGREDTRIFVQFTKTN